MCFLCLPFHCLDISYTTGPLDHVTFQRSNHVAHFSRDVVLSQSGGGMIACAVSTHDAPGWPWPQLTSSCERHSDLSLTKALATSSLVRCERMRRMVHPVSSRWILQQTSHRFRKNAFQSNANFPLATVWAKSCWTCPLGVVAVLWGPNYISLNMLGGGAVPRGSCMIGDVSLR